MAAPLPDYDEPPAPPTEPSLVAAAARACADPEVATLPPDRAALHVLVPLAAAGWARGRVHRYVASQLGRPGMASLATVRAQVGADQFAAMLDGWYAVARRHAGQQGTERLADRLYAHWWQLATVEWGHWSDRAVALAVARRAWRWRSRAITYSAAALGAIAGVDQRTVQRATIRLTAFEAGDPRRFTVRQPRPGWPLRWQVSAGARSTTPSRREGYEVRQLAVAPQVADTMMAPHDGWLGARGTPDATHAVLCALAVTDSLATADIAAHLGRPANSPPIRAVLHALSHAGVVVEAGPRGEWRLADVDDLPAALGRLAVVRGTDGTLARRWAMYEAQREERLVAVGSYARASADGRAAGALVEHLRSQPLPWDQPSDRWQQAAEDLVIAAVDGARAVLAQVRRAVAAGPVTGEDVGWVAALALRRLPWPSAWGETATWAVEQARVLGAE